MITQRRADKMAACLLGAWRWQPTTKVIAQAAPQLCSRGVTVHISRRKIINSCPYQVNDSNYKQVKGQVLWTDEISTTLLTMQFHWWSYNAASLILPLHFSLYLMHNWRNVLFDTRMNPALHVPCTTLFLWGVFFAKYPVGWQVSSHF